MSFCAAVFLLCLEVFGHVSEARRVTVSKLHATPSTISNKQTSKYSSDGFRGHSRRPDLGRFSDRFTARSFLASGGQANVWVGMEEPQKREIVMRFPHGMCEESFCKVGELDAATIQEMQTACGMAMAAVERFEQIKDSNQQPMPTPPYSACIQSISAEASDIAFDVWELSGDATLAEGFFMKTSVGELTIDEKREVLKKLRDAVSILADESVLSEPCCCSRTVTAQCTTKPDFLVGKFGRTCPSDFEASPGMCGPLVHHDIKLDNIMLRSVDHDHRVEPVLIDFGAATRCEKGEAHAYSLDWVPFWLNDPHLVSPTECWSYDTYAVGLAWLVTELLVDLPADALICNAMQIEKGTISGKIQVAPESDGIDVAGQETSLQNCDDVPSDWWLRQDALRPVNLLIRELRSQLNRYKPIDNSSVFIDFVRRFVSSYGRGGASGDTLTLPLTMPKEKILSADVWPLLQECPSFPSRMGTSNLGLDITHWNAQMRCRMNAANRDFNAAVRTQNTEEIARHVLKFNGICDDLRQRLSSEGTSSEIGLGDYCRDQRSRSNALVTIVSWGSVDQLAHFLEGIDHKGWDDLNSTRLELLRRPLPHGETLLAVAARRRLEPMVRFLLDQGASPLGCHDCGEYSNNRLLEGPTREVSSWDMSSKVPLVPLLAAATTPKNGPVLKLLLDSVSADLAPNESLPATLASLHVLQTPTGQAVGPSIVGLAVEHGDVEMIEMIIQLLRPDVEITSRMLAGSGAGSVPLLRAASAGRSEACKLLLREGVSTDVTDTDGRTPLLSAVLSGSVPTVSALVDALQPGAVNEIVPKFGSPLHVAAKMGDAAIARTLLDLGAKSALKDLQGNTPLHVAVSAGDVALPALKVLADRDDAHMSVNKRGETPIVLAASLCNSPKAFQLVLDTVPAEALLITNNMGFASIHVAAAEGNLGCLDRLVARVPVSTRSGRESLTPLAVATERGQIFAIERLISHGASPHDRDAKGRPLAMRIGWRDLKPRFGRRKTFSLFKKLFRTSWKEMMADRDAIGMSVFGRFVFDGDVRMVKYLLSLGLNCDTLAFKRQREVDEDAVTRFVGPDKHYPANKGITPLALVRKRLETLRSERMQSRDMSYMEAGQVNYASIYIGQAQYTRRVGPAAERIRTLVENLVFLERLFENLKCNGQGTQRDRAWERHRRLFGRPRQRRNFRA